MILDENTICKDLLIQANQSKPAREEIFGDFQLITGQVPSNSTKDIACWLIDAGYNGNSFFVSYAYFTDGWYKFERIIKILKAEIDGVAYDSLLFHWWPFLRSSKSDKMALKVINHFGDKVQKVVEVG